MRRPHKSLRSHSANGIRIGRASSLRAVPYRGERAPAPSKSRCIVNGAGAWLIRFDRQPPAEPVALRAFLSRGLGQPRRGALDHLAAADRLCAIRSSSRRGLRRRGVGRAGIERRRRVVFEPELDRFRGLRSMQQRHQRQREIDARGDAAAGDAVAVDADARLGRGRAERPTGNPSRVQCVAAR